MSIFITGDIHGTYDIYKLYKFNRLYGHTLSKQDYLIICGDFGFIWNDTPDEEKLYNLQVLDSFPWTTLFVDGNHENHTRLESLPSQFFLDGSAHKMSDSVYHLKRGEIFEIHEKLFFCFGGAFSHDRFLREEGESWWSHELPSKDECEQAMENLSSIDNTVDYIISHDAPRSMAKLVGYRRENMGNGYPLDRVNICAFLEHMYQTISYKHWYCGHYHIDQDINSFHFLYNTILDLETNRIVCDDTPLFSMGETVTFVYNGKSYNGIIKENKRKDKNGVYVYNICVDDKMYYRVLEKDIL